MDFSQPLTTMESLIASGAIVYMAILFYYNVIHHDDED